MEAVPGEDIAVSAIKAIERHSRGLHETWGDDSVMDLVLDGEGGLLEASVPTFVEFLEQVESAIRDLDIH